MKWLQLWFPPHLSCRLAMPLHSSLTRRLSRVCRCIRCFGPHVASSCILALARHPGICLALTRFCACISTFISRVYSSTRHPNLFSQGPLLASRHSSSPDIPQFLPPLFPESFRPPLPLVSATAVSVPPSQWRRRHFFRHPFTLPLPLSVPPVCFLHPASALLSQRCRAAGAKALYAHSEKLAPAPGARPTSHSCTVRTRPPLVAPSHTRVSSLG